jgi:TatD DNase family protein
MIDVHTHIDQHAPTELDGIISRARAAGVGALITAGVTLESSARCVQVAAEYPDVFAGVGVHPEDMTAELSNRDLDALRRLAASPRVVVMSEIGLDHTPPERLHPAPGSDWRPSTGPEWRAAQEHAFRAQIGVARELGLAVVFHNREATADTLRVLREERAGDLGGAAHYFQGGWEYAKSVIDLGLMVSLAKPLLRSPELQDVARRLPMESIVLETDSYPQPFKRDRSKWTEPKDLADVADKLAELRGMDVEVVKAQTTANALRMLGERGAAVGKVLPG